MTRLLLLFADEATSATAPSLPNLMRQVVSTVVFTLIGMLVFAISFWLIVKLAPFSVRKEIEEDHNMALSIIIGSIIIGIAMIIAAAVHG